MWVCALLPSVFLLEGCTKPTPPTLVWHGNFCGPGYPVIESTTTDDRVEKLTSLQPFDDVDKSCKEHDLCYVRLGRNDIVCDELLERTLDHRSFSPECADLAINIKNYFANIHPNEGLIRNTTKAIFGSAFMGLQYSAIALGDPSVIQRLDKDQTCNIDRKYSQIYTSDAQAKRSLSIRHLPWMINVLDQEDKAREMVRREGQLACRDLSQLGMYYELGVGVRQDYRKAKEMYLRAAYCGDYTAPLLLGELYYDGKGVPRDNNKAEMWFKRCSPGDSSHCDRMLKLIEYQRTYNQYSGWES
jgi:hypothetical protein